VPEGTVGIVISLIGKATPKRNVDDTHTRNNPIEKGYELVEEGYRGVLKEPLSIGNHPINTKVKRVVLVPTYQITLDWSDDKTKTDDNYDKKLGVLKLVSKDGFVLDVAVRQRFRVPREKAPVMISHLGFPGDSEPETVGSSSGSSSPRRFKSIRDLIVRVLEPAVSTYFYNAVQDHEALAFYQDRREQQKSVADRLKAILSDYGVEAIDTLISEIDLPDSLQNLLNSSTIEKLKADLSKVQQETEEIRELTYLKAITAIQADLAQFQQGVQIAELKVKVQEYQTLAQAKSTEEQGKSQARVQADIMRAIVDVIGRDNYVDIEKLNQLASLKLPNLSINNSGDTNSGPSDVFMDSMLEKIASVNSEDETLRQQRIDCDLPVQETLYIYAEMDDRVVVNRVTTLEIILSQEELELAIGATSQSGKVEIDNQQPLLIQVVTKTNFVVVDEDRTEVAPPSPHQPQHLYFDIRATHIGAGEIWVVVRQKQVSLLTLILKPQIVESKTALPGRSYTYGRIIESPNLTEPLHQLRIVERRNGLHLTYQYELNSPILNILSLYESKPITSNRYEYVENLYKEIETRWLTSQNDVEEFAAELRAFGGRLFDDLFPEGLQRQLWEHRQEFKSIMVISTEPFIPWELVHLKPPKQSYLPEETCFLGQLGLVRWLHEAGFPPNYLTIKKDRANYIIPHYPIDRYRLPQAEQETKFLEQIFQATPIEPQLTAVRKALDSGSFDLLHFAGHGQADQDNIANSKLLLEGRIENNKYIHSYLSSTTVEQYFKSNGNRPMIVLNACQIGREGYTLTGIGGFAQAFLKGGAGVFVGSLWSVGDKPARIFTETLYSGLNEGLTLSEATIRARQQAQQAGDSTWLAYTVYGHPLSKWTVQSELSANKVCQFCSCENSNFANFCYMCGAKLHQDFTKQEVSQKQSVLPSVSINSSDSSLSTPIAAHLVAKQADPPISEFLLVEGMVVIIGRFDPDTGSVDVDLEGFAGCETVSNNHAEIYQQEGAWLIRDLGSVNGVFIKPCGQNRFEPRIIVPQALKTGDEISIGKVCFLFQRI
jgi:Skp family chaperone for outer membrane proteins